MIGSVNQSKLGFQGAFEIEKLPLKKFKGIIMDMNPKTIEDMTLVLPKLKDKVEKILPPNDKVEFKLFKSMLFGDNRFKIKYIPSQESKAKGLTSKVDENWPININDALDFVDDVINKVGNNTPSQNLFNKKLNILA